MPPGPLPPHPTGYYARQADLFLTWCQAHGLKEISEVRTEHVAAYIERLTRSELEAASIKQAFSALRMLFSWLVVHQVVRDNPTASVRGPKLVVAEGKTLTCRPRTWCGSSSVRFARRPARPGAHRVMAYTPSAPDRRRGRHERRRLLTAGQAVVFTVQGEGRQAQVSVPDEFSLNVPIENSLIGV